MPEQEDYTMVARAQALLEGRDPEDYPRFEDGTVDISSCTPQQMKQYQEEQTHETAREAGREVAPSSTRSHPGQPDPARPQLRADRDKEAQGPLLVHLLIMPDGTTTVLHSQFIPTT